MTATTRRLRGLALLSALLLVLPALAQQPLADDLVLHADAAGTTLALPGNSAFHETTQTVLNARLIDVPGTPVRLATWDELQDDGNVQPFYAISLDGHSMNTVRATSYVLKVRYADFDPAAGAPPVSSDLADDGAGNLYLVQFVTQPLNEFRSAIENLGGVIYKFVPHHAHIVKMTPAVRDQVAALPYVRWVGPYQPAYRLEEFMRDNRDQAENLFPWQRYNIQVCEAGMAQKFLVGEHIRALGGIVNMPHAGKYLLEATLTPEMLDQVIHWDEVLWVDRWSPYTTDMDKVRQVGGADYLETVAGFDGAGVRGEVIDIGFNLTHVDFASRPLILHTDVSSASHGASTSGICFGDGTGDPTARGLLPAGQGIVADWDVISVGEPRYDLTGELVQDPYYAVFQTASVGSAQTSQYTSVSADTDEMLFDFDIVHCQSQSNLGSTSSRPQAWAKNIISGGAVEHYDTATRDDDCWCYSGSIGPATDGRIKPDLCFWYDYTRTVTTGGTTAYTDTFGGTSGATPSICGYTGLFFQMWDEGIFGNEVDPGATVFENRPHMTTAKAFMINTASPYPFTGTGDDMTRVHQGWGLPDVQYMYDMRDNISFINETEILTNMQSVDYAAFVADLPDPPALRITLVYADPSGLPSASQQRINDLTLKVISPAGTVYWGNNGLLAGLWSTPGGTPNEVDTVENVFIEDPEPGIWTVTVIASEINEDSHVETPEEDADFALVVSGAFLATCTSDGRIALDNTKFACDGQVGIRVIDCDLNTDDLVIDTTTVTIASNTEEAGETVVLTETGPETADFRGSIALSTSDADGVLQITHDDTIIATYVDADDGTGATVTVTATGLADCEPPLITGVVATDIQPRTATIQFQTDEPAAGTIRYGTDCAGLTESQAVTGFKTSHLIGLSGLDDDTTYFYVVDAVDEAGNAITADNGGVCFSFTTPEVPDFFTELFTSGNDLDHLSLIFEPTLGSDRYRTCVESIDTLPSDPNNGTVLTLSGDSYATVNLSGFQRVVLYNTPHTTLYVGSNGYITFDAGDTDWSESLEDHFEQPRISGLFNDLSTGSGSISWRAFPDHVAVTWWQVSDGSSSTSTFQIEMFFNGKIRLNYLDISATDGLAGLSEGLGVSPDFYPTDLSDMGACVPLVFELPAGPPIYLTPSTPTVIPVLIEDGREHYVPGSGLLHYRYDGGDLLTAPLVHVGGHEYEATLPPATCSATPEFYFSATGQLGSTVYLPKNAPLGRYTATVAIVSDVFGDNFQSDLGWTVVDDPSLTDGSWQRGDPAGDGSHGDPTQDFDGSGKCYLTANRAGNSDVDWGPTWLISPALDMSSMHDPLLSFAYWWSNDDWDGDQLTIELSDDDGATWTLVHEYTLLLGQPPAWKQDAVHIADYVSLTATVRVRFAANDTPNNSIDEGAIDAVSIIDIACLEGTLGDMNCDGILNYADIDPFVQALSCPGGNPACWDPACPWLNGDCNEDGTVNYADIDPFVARLASGG